VRTVLLDADTELYRVALRNEHVEDWGDGDPAVTCDHQTARDELRAYVDDIKAALFADEVIVALTDYEKPNFRKAFYPEYKAKRGPKPAMLPALRKFMVDNFKTYIRPTLEADDIVGILSTHPTLIRGEKIIVSIDKDLMTIPGLLFNPDKHKEPVEILPKDAYMFFLTQVLIGDTTDNYPGCPGIGPVNAALILDVVKKQTPRSLWDAVVDVFEASTLKGESRGLTANDALIQARCARILRNTEYNAKTKQVILWQPPQRKKR